jgi:hypothetical protein
MQGGNDDVNSVECGSGAKPSLGSRRRCLTELALGDPADRGIDGALYQGRVEALV